MRIERRIAIVSGVVEYSLCSCFFIFLSRCPVFAGVELCFHHLEDGTDFISMVSGITSWRHRSTEAVSQARVEVCVCICSCSIFCELLIVLLKDADPMLGAYAAYGWTHLLWNIGAAMGRGLFINLRNLVVFSGIRIQLGACAP